MAQAVGRDIENPGVILTVAVKDSDTKVDDENTWYSISMVIFYIDGDILYRWWYSISMVFFSYYSYSLFSKGGL